jgi:hypothetical protein
MKRIFSVIALGVALSLSTTSFKAASTDDDDCEVTKDLSVTAALDREEIGDGELDGKIVNASRSRDYDGVMIRVDFLGDNVGTLSSSDRDMDDDDLDQDNVTIGSNDNDVTISTDDDLTIQSDDNNVTIQSDDDHLAIESGDVNTGNNGSSSTVNGSRVLGSQVFTIHEDVEAGETESFHLNVVPPAGTTHVAYSLVCANDD